MRMQGGAAASTGPAQGIQPLAHAVLFGVAQGEHLVGIAVLKQGLDRQSQRHTAVAPFQPRDGGA
ncbi:hypothetical protein D3C73_1466840 [compost metagenome]